MARISKEGLDYYPEDTGMLSSRCMRRLIRKHGPAAIAVVVALRSSVYGEKGYYLEWNEDACFDLSERANTGMETVQAVIMDMMNMEMLCAEMFKAHGVLTSEDIQRQYVQCTLKRKNVVIREEYKLINAPRTTLWGDETEVCGTQSGVCGAEMQQRKEKEIESKQKEKKTSSPLQGSPPGSPESSEALHPGVHVGSGVVHHPGLKATPPREGGELERQDAATVGGGIDEKVLVNGRRVPQYCLDKRTHNCEGLLERLNQIHVMDVGEVNRILEKCDYGRIGHPIWGIIWHSNWPKGGGIKFPGKFILSQLKKLE